MEIAIGIVIGGAVVFIGGTAWFIYTFKDFMG